MIVEIRTYRLRPGTRERFLAALTARAVPLLAEFGIEVVAAGASLAEENDGDETAYLVRAFADVDALVSAEERFYTSSEWIDGPRAELLACIDHYTSVVLPRSALVGLGYRP